MNAGQVKHCPVCGQDKGPTAFHVDRSRLDGLKWNCRACANATERARQRDRRGRIRYPRRSVRVGRFAPVMPREGWCPNCSTGRHGPDCTAAYFGPDCTCGCGALGYRNPYGERDPFAPAPMDREIA